MCRNQKYLIFKLIFFPIIVDACCVRLEWIYSQEMMARIIGKEDPVFWKDSHSPYYILENGKISGYGDQARIDN